MSTWRLWPWAVAFGANALSRPPGEYGRKIKTQMNWRGPHKRWSMWFNSCSTWRTLHLAGHPEKPAERRRAFRNSETGAAWLSSARVVKCWVKVPQRAQPLSLFANGNVRNSVLPVITGGRWGRRQRSSWPLRVGLHVLQWRIQRAANLQWANPKKVRRSPDWSLQLDCEVGPPLIVDQNATVGDAVPRALHRPSHHGSGLQEVGSLTFQEDAHHFLWFMTGVKS